MKRFAYLLVPLILSATGCSIHFPPQIFEDDYFPVTVTLQVDPDDAQVLLDGRLIGEAYEFTGQETAIRLGSHNHTLTISRQGFTEEQIDLQDYDQRTVILTLNLMPLASIPSDGPKAINKRYPNRKPDEDTPPVTKEETGVASADDEAKKVAKTEEMPSPRFALNLTVKPAEAAIYINDKFWGIAPPSGQIGNILFAETKVTIAVFKPGFKKYKKSIVLDEKGSELIINLELEK